MNRYLKEIEPYKTARGGYDIPALLRELGVTTSIMDTLGMMGDDAQYHHPDPRVNLAMQINASLYDAEQTKQQEDLNAAWQRWQANTATQADCLLLERAGWIAGIYDDPDSNRPTGWRDRPVQGNQYSDQAGLEENPGRL